MDGGLLSLKWNNHRSTFFHVLSSVRKKDRYSDATIACDGKFYKVHKLVMSTCSEYFEQMFEQTDCKNPVIVLKDIKSEELESLLSYMYVGEVNVVQEKLAGLIKAAECLKIKGLAVPDEEPQSSKPSNREKRSADSNASSEPKRRKEEVRQSYNNISSEERRKSSDNSRYRNSSNNSSTVENTQVGGESNDSLVSSNQNAVPVKEEANAVQYSDPPPEVTLDDPQEVVKQEPNDMDAVYIDDSNSASESKDMLMDNFDDGDGQQHFMDELLGQNSDQTNMSGVGNFNDGGEGSAGGSQQHMRSGDQVGSAIESPLRRPSFNFDFPRAVATAYSTQEAARHRPVEPSRYEGMPLNHPVELEDVNALQSSTFERRSEAEEQNLERCFDKTRRVFLCPFCDKQFRARGDFRRHYRVHTGQKPFACLLCPYRAVQRKNLVGHMVRQHNIVDNQSLQM